MAEIVSFNPNLGTVTIAAAPGEDISGWTFESYSKSGNTASYFASGAVDTSDPQVSASDPSVIYYTSSFGLATGNQRDAVALVDENGNVVEIVGWGNDPSYALVGGSAGGQTVDPSNDNFAGDNDQGWYAKSPGSSWNGNNGSPDDGLPDDLQPYAPPCFTAGMLIDTASGRVCVETLRAGDVVLNSAGDTRTIRWVGRKRIEFADKAKRDHLRPIRILAHAFGTGLPDRDLRVSPRHRIALSDPWYELHFGSRDVLVAAVHLVNGTTVARDRDCKSVDYVHLLFDQHEVLISNGLPSESFHPGSMTIPGLEADQREELFQIFPELEDDPVVFGSSCLPTLRGWEARLINDHFASLPNGCGGR
ncbi:Hint domain-containing protein [Pukyongiella litopenaei]|uniref:Hint domain-containing protein n=1 Tax=Pukyongiella litopenaei TaxID=2605946 RepID=A0A2S0MNR2_9RHOB|nr:Hint domain-containing protein [Pukyongiella litopenaei]AVO37515.1 Hint domain-containing protein [Pukyongiella litopenaei]